MGQPNLRITYALDHHGADWGGRDRVAFVGVPAGYPVRDMIVAVHASSAHILSWRADDFAAWSSSGMELGRSWTDLDGVFDLILIVLPRAKHQARDMIAKACGALAEDGLLIIDGAKEDGVDAMLKDLRRMDADPVSVSKAHGRVMWCARFDAQAWLAEDFTDIGDGFETSVGIFSADGPDTGSALLAVHLPYKLGARVADLGAGWGYLSRHVLERSPDATLDLIELDDRALSCARRNLASFGARAQFHWGDVIAEPNLLRQRSYDTVVMNPPFHVGRAADVSLGRGFIAAAAKLLRPKGALWMVANRHLPYEDTLETLFKTVSKPEQTGAFKILHAVGVK